jgi:hypothetical protein
MNASNDFQSILLSGFDNFFNDIITLFVVSNDDDDDDDEDFEDDEDDDDDVAYDLIALIL